MTRTERGWQGHLCIPCTFHLNTLLNAQLVVSTVGLAVSSYGLSTLGPYGEYFETKAFEAIWEPNREIYIANTSKPVELSFSQSIKDINDIKGACDMHEVVVNEITLRSANLHTV